MPSSIYPWPRRPLPHGAASICPDLASYWCNAPGVGAGYGAFYQTAPFKDAKQLAWIVLGTWNSNIFFNFRNTNPR
jgi:hypothetical protein